MYTNSLIDSEFEKTLIAVLQEMAPDVLNEPEILDQSQPPHQPQPETVDQKPIIQKPILPPLVIRKTPKIPVKMLDFHTKICQACQDRNNFIKELYSIPFKPEQHVDEIISRDQMLEEMIDECRKCFVKTNNL